MSEMTIGILHAVLSLAFWGLIILCVRLNPSTWSKKIMYFAIGFLVWITFFMMPFVYVIPILWLAIVYFRLKNDSAKVGNESP